MMKEEKNEDLVYIDQSGMDNRDVYEYGWGLKGQRIYGQRPGKKRERISMMSGYHLGKLVAPFTWIGIAKQAKVGMIWVAGRSPTLVSQNLKATTLTYLAIDINKEGDCLE